MHKVLVEKMLMPLEAADQVQQQLDFVTNEGFIRGIKFRQTNALKPLSASNGVGADGNRVVVGGPKSSYIECTKPGKIMKIKAPGRLCM